ncbi:IS3 family transposase [Neomicrococcus aestuarii]|uniref:IS3 family transposase n=1 Tax=Neomicrococcus aestuarii TaxID=556325 RepID=UPI00160CAFD0|nr:IS3 family transposase [Neomicrococcus aestuarii]
MPKQFPPEVRDRAVRMTMDRLSEYPSVYAACKALAPKLGVGPESLRRWVVQAQIDAGEKTGPSTDELEEIKRLRAEVRDLKESNEILKQASNFLREGARPSPPLICRFIDEMRAEGYAVESICAVLREQGVRVAARTYRAWKKRLPALRTIEDARLTDALRAVKVPDAKGRPRPEIIYGRRKMTQWLRRNGFPEASKHTVDRLMREEGMNGLVRGRKTRTTIPGKDGRRAGDLVNRDFTAAAPNQIWVTDFTYVPVYSGFVYVALVIDLYSRAILGWETSTVKDTAFVEHCLRMALWRREHTGRPAPTGLIHHSDAGSQYTSIRYTDTLALEGLQPSIGSVGDAYDNAAAETVMGLFKNEAVAKDSPFRSGALKTETDVMEIVFEWVHWYNNERLHSALDHQTPEEYEQTYYDLQTSSLPDDAANKQAA